MIEPVHAITNLVDDENIEEEIASFPEEVQAQMYSLKKEILRDELKFVVQMERYRRRPLQRLYAQ